MTEKRQTVGQAFDDFAKKFRRSSQFSDGSKPNIIYEDDLVQKKINATEDAFRKTVVSSYAKYLNPFKVYGRNSAQAKEISEDEENLVRAYNLFKAVKEANLSYGTDDTFIKTSKISSPLTSKNIYTAGGEFLYLQCWLIQARNVRDYIPELVEHEENFQTVYSLEFYPLRSYKFDRRDKEIIAVLQETYGNLLQVP